MSHALRCILCHPPCARLFLSLLPVSVGCGDRLFYCPLYLQRSKYRKNNVPLLFYSVHISGKTVLKRSAEKRSILQVFQSFQTGTTDTGAAPARVLNLLGNTGTTCIQKWMTRSGRGAAVHCSYPAATVTKESNGDKGAESPKLSLAMCDFPFLV